MRKVILIVAALVLVGVLALNAFVIVDPTAFVYVTQFGRPEVTYDENDTGLHWRWPAPVQSVERIDRRLQVLDLPGIEVLTRDREKNANTIDKTLTIDAYVCWRVKDRDGVDRFIRKLGTMDRAKTLLGQRVTSQLAAEVARLSMDDLVNTAEGKVSKSLSKLRESLLNRQRPEADREYGIQIVDIRVRRFNYPQQVQETIFNRIRSERAIRAANYRQQGTIQAEKIRQDAAKQRRIIEADAKAQADQLRGEALAQADRIRNQAGREERDFYKFLKKLEDYSTMLGTGRTVLYLSTQRELFDLLLNSRGDGSKAKPAPGPGPLAVQKTGK